MAQIDQNVLLYLRGDTFLDLAPNPISTIVGVNPTLVNNNGPAFYFNGTTMFLQVSWATFDNIISSDFTLEYEISLTSINQTYPTPLGWMSNMGGPINERFHYSHWMSTSSINIYNTIDDNSVMLAPSTTANTWFHVALVRQGNTLNTYFNGILANSTPLSSSSIPANINNLFIGAMASNNVSTYFNGHVKNIMLTKGAKYLNNFTPTFEAHSTIYVDNVMLINGTLTFNVKALSANETINKVELLINNNIVQTYTNNYNGIIYNLPEEYNGTVNVEIRAYYYENLFISKTMEYMVIKVDRLESNSSILAINNKLQEIGSYYDSLYDHLYSLLESKNVNVSRDMPFGVLVNMVNELPAKK